MKIFLKEDVKNLGTMGEVVNVADGYARNFLIPKKFAVEANTKNIREFEHHKKTLLEKAAKVKELHKTTAEKLSSLTLTLTANAGEEGKLFGSITNMDIAEALKAEGHDIDKKKIEMEEPIKRLGDYTVEIRVYPEVIAKIKVQVVANTPETA